jgi:predicted phage-related endonuclease
MGNRALENRINRIMALDAQAAELKKQADAIREEIKAEMESQGTNELHTPNFIVRWKEIISSRFDSKTFKTTHPALYEAFATATASKRFTIV